MNDVNQQRVSLEKMVALMQVAMVSLAHGLMPIVLVLRRILLKVLDTFEV